MATLTNNSNKLEELIEILPEKSLPKTNFNDATATAAQIYKGYTAYAGTDKLTGTAQLPSEAEADAFRKYAPLALQAGAELVYNSAYNDSMYESSKFRNETIGTGTYKYTDDISIKYVTSTAASATYEIRNKNPYNDVTLFIKVTRTIIPDLNPDTGLGGGVIGPVMPSVPSFSKCQVAANSISSLEVDVGLALGSYSWNYTVEGMIWSEA